MSHNKKSEDKPSTHKELKGFDIHINELGQINSSMPYDKLNEFLDRNLEDKKLKNKVSEEE